MKVLLTGTMCSGKSTCTRLLEARGFQVVHEQAEVLIKAGDYHPAINFEEFQFVLFWAIERSQRNLPEGQLVFLDRSYLDAVAFFKDRGLEVPEYFSEIDPDRYSRIFLFEPLNWENNGVRWEGTEVQQRIHNYLKEVYPRHTLVPDFGDPEKRVDFILNELVV